MLPFQYLFIAAAVMWALSQMIPVNHIQIKMQSTSALIMMMIGMTITGVVTIPQFEPEKPLHYSEPQQALLRDRDIPKAAKMDTFGPDDLDRDIQRLRKY
jgi:hypothetical protein